MNTDELPPLVYLGTPEMAVPPLLALVDCGFPIRLVVTRADARRGRGKGTVGSPVKLAAEALGLPVSHDVDDVLDTDAQIGVVVAFGRIIRPHVLERLQMVNLHFSLLPRWRGAAPVERAVLAGDVETGVAVMEVEEGLDTGGIHAEVRVPIAPDATASDLRAELVAAGTTLLVDTLRAGLGEPRPQVGEPVYAAKIEVGDLRLDFTSSAEENHRRVRLGRAWCEFRGERLIVWGAVPDPTLTLAPGMLAMTAEGPAVGFDQGSLSLREVQPAGRKRMTATAWWNGVQPEADEHLT